MRCRYRADSIAYVIVISGKIDIELGNGVQARVKQGDVRVQRGAIHHWISDGTEVCNLAVILIHANPVEAGGQVLYAMG